MNSTRLRFVILVWALLGLGFVFLLERRQLPVASQPGQCWDANYLHVAFSWCPAGEFDMGEPEKSRRVKIAQEFWISRSEVTRGQWESVMATTPWQVDSASLPDDDMPAVGMTWIEAMEFCRRFSEIEHRTGRLPASWEFCLPTETQWEYACRAGSTGLFGFGDYVDALREHAWYTPHGETNLRYTSPEPLHVVGGKKPNAWRLVDCHGNVAEWCLDAEESTTAFKAIRGGSSRSSARDVACHARDLVSQSESRDDLGFRIVLTPVRVELKWPAGAKK